VTRYGRRVPGLDVDEGAEACVHCGLTYAALRTGLTYKDVWCMHWVSSDDARKWKYKRRNTVLGKWHEIKRALWIEHLYTCAEFALSAEEDA
jgi:hypothetical protein